MIQSVLVLFLFAVLQKAFGDVIHLTEDTFDQHVDGSSNILVEFYAPWCGHCKSLAPEWKIVGETFQPTDDIKIAALDATTAQKIATKYGVSGYPTIKFFPKGSTTPEDYNGGRTADTIVSWVNNKVGTSRKLKVAPTAVAQLATEDFDSEVLKKERPALVEFYAPWCGHCKQLAPTYEQLALAFQADKEDILIAKVDATEDGAIADRYEVQGYPTIKYFPKGVDAAPEPYEGGRTLEAFVEFINSKAGTSRTPDGKLTSKTGRVAALDTILSTAKYVVNTDLVQDLSTASAAFTEKKVQAYAKIYLATAEKVISKGADYVEKELARLTKMMASPSLKPESRSNFELKSNILRAFSSKAAAAEEEEAEVAKGADAGKEEEEL